MSTIPAFTFGGITRPALTLDPVGEYHSGSWRRRRLWRLTGLRRCMPAAPRDTVSSDPGFADDTGRQQRGGQQCRPKGPGQYVRRHHGFGAQPASVLNHLFAVANLERRLQHQPATGVVTVADPTKIDFESRPATPTRHGQGGDGLHRHEKFTSASPTWRQRRRSTATPPPTRSRKAPRPAPPSASPPFDRHQRPGPSPTQLGADIPAAASP